MHVAGHRHSANDTSHRHHLGGNVCRAPARAGEDCATVDCDDSSFCGGDGEAPKCVAYDDDDTQICEA